MPLHRTYFHDIYDPAQIDAGILSVCESVNDSDFRAQHPINQACLFHHGFMKVFPFADGSGKVGRLLMAYYESLKDGPVGLRLIVIEAMEQAVDAGVRHLRERLRARSVVRSRVRSWA